MSNYRPISLISNVAKIIEKIIKKRIINFLNKYNIISSKQFGFKEGVSTEDAIIYLTNNIYSKLDENKAVLCVFLDLAKAFDTVDHKILLGILEDLGFRGVALNLIKTYLSNRIQYVQIENSISEKTQIEFGVPQGTVLGPVLFSIYINGLLRLESEGTVSSFADDTVIQYTADSWKEIKPLAENDLKKIKTWFDEMLLTINFEKTKYVPFSCNKTKIPQFHQLSFKVYDTDIIIEEANQIKYLGIEIDRYLKWDVHIKMLVKKLRSILFKFRQLKKILEIPQLKTIYFALIESHIRYGIAGWGGAYKNHLKQLEVIQKQFIKIMYQKNNTYPSNMLYTDSNLLDIRQIYCQKMLIAQHKKRNELVTIQHQHDTRYKKGNKPRNERVNKAIAQRSFLFLAPRIYGLIPENIRQFNNLKHFKKYMKEWVCYTPRTLLHSYIDLNK